MDANIVRENNKLIVQFMGATIKNRGSYEAYSFNGHQTESFIYALNYDKKWEQLMPVVEKIETLKTKKDGFFGVYIFSNNCVIQGTKFHSDPEKFHEAYFNTNHGITKIIATYITVVQFITWYNTL